MQYSYTGTATDRPVMEWLNTYAFPRETAHSDSDAATKEYMKLCNRLVAHGTTTVLIFGTIYKEACQRLALCLQAQGLRGFVGKVCMDRWAAFAPSVCNHMNMASESHARVMSCLSCMCHRHNLPSHVPIA